MILDNLLCFTGTSKGATAGAPAQNAQTDLPTTVTQLSSNVIDLGIVGLPVFASGGGARDIGIGDDPAMKILVIVTVAITGGTSLQVNLQGAPDSGTGTQGSYTTMISSPVVAEASLIAGARLLDADVPRPVPGQAIPRFLLLQYISVGTHSAGSLQGYLVLDRHDQPLQSNAVLGGYPPGIAIAN